MRLARRVVLLTQKHFYEASTRVYDKKEYEELMAKLNLILTKESRYKVSSGVGGVNVNSRQQQSPHFPDLRLQLH